MAVKAALAGIASCVPDRKLTNEELVVEFPDWNISKIYNKTGIRTRGLSAEGECASDLGVNAAQRLFAQGKCQPDQIDFLLFCTQSPDYFLPTTACLMQERLALRTDCGALDYNLGCSGFVYGLALAKGLIETGQANRVLLITAETYTKYLEAQDRSVRTLFGDGAAACLVSGMDAVEEMIGPFIFGTDGRGGGNLIVRGGASRAGGPEADAYLRMNGPEIFNFTLEAVPTAVRALVEKSDVGLEQIDYFVFHQANRFMLESLRKKLGLPAERFCINMDDYGNTVSATVPMALELALARDEVGRGARVMLVGFGVGYSWAATLLTLP